MIMKDEFLGAAYTPSLQFCCTLKTLKLQQITAGLFYTQEQVISISSSVFFTRGNMRLVILDDYDKASEWAAKYVRNRILEFKPTEDRPFVLGVPTGNHTHHVECIGSAVDL